MLIQMAPGTSLTIQMLVSNVYSAIEQHFSHNRKLRTSICTYSTQNILDLAYERLTEQQKILAMHFKENLASWHKMRNSSPLKLCGRL